MLSRSWFQPPAHTCACVAHAARFLLYHVELYVTHYKISESAFFYGSFLFLVWNAVNDFVLGWLTDGSLVSADNSTSSTAARRVALVLVGLV